MPTGIDDLSIIFVHVNLTQSKNKRFWNNWVTKQWKLTQPKLNMIFLYHYDCWWQNKSQVGVTATAAKALSENEEHSNDLARF